MDLDRSTAATRERKRLHAAFRRLVAPAIRGHGFRGRGGHFLRRVGQVERVVELQTSVYGQRFTANLGLDLYWLAPAARWVERPKLGPQAHDCVRWIRLGLVHEEGRDLWFGFETDEAMEASCLALADLLVREGLPWLERESTPAAFLAHASERVERSKSSRYPLGRYGELRLLAAVLAWNGRFDEAKTTAEHARACWADERERMMQAYLRYGRAFPHRSVDPTAVPDLQTELDGLIVRAAERPLA